MKKLLILVLFLATQLLADLVPEWSKDFFGPINQMEFADLDGDGQKEIVAGGTSGIFALKEDGTILWKNKSTNSIDTLIAFQADEDDELEFATATYIDTRIFDNDGTQLDWTIMKWSAGYKLPLASLGDDVISYYDDDSTTGLMFSKEYTPFYDSGNVPSNGLAGVDSNANGVNDILFGISDVNVTIFRLNSSGDEVWENELSIGESDSLNFLWAGKLNNGNITEVIGTSDGYLFALDSNGDELWTQKCDMSIKDIIKDKDGGFLVTSNYDYFMFAGTENILYKIDENNGSILWQHSSGENITKAVAQDNHQIAAGFGSNVKIFNSTGTILQDVNISIPSWNDYLDIYSLKFDSLGSKDGLFIGTMDITRMHDGNATEKVFSGGAQVTRVASGDMNDDSKDEIALEDGTRLYLYSDAGELLWAKDDYKMFPKNDYLKQEDISFSDLTGDGKDELIAVNDGNMTILDYYGSVVWHKYIDARKIYLYDYNKDGAQDIFIAYSDTDPNEGIQVFNGKDGVLLHDYGRVSSYCNYMKVFNVNGVEKFYYADYDGNYWLLKDETISSKTLSNIAIYSYNNYQDINGDGVIDFITVYETSGTSADIQVYDLTKEGSSAVLINTTTISKTEYINNMKLYDYNNDGTYEILISTPSKAALYSMNDGSPIWDFDAESDRALTDIKIAKAPTGDRIFVSGKEVYVFDKDGTKLQEISPTDYMSEANYFLPITLARTADTDAQLIVGSMGVYSYSGVKILEEVEDSDTSFLPAIFYLLQ